MEIPGIKGQFNPIQGISQPTTGQAQGSVPGKSFGEVFTDALREVDDLQKVADKKIESVTLGTGEVQPHDAMLALEKADLAFQLMTQIRAKIIRAYEDVLRTQV